VTGTGVIIGVDVGGTFTDFFLLDAAACTFATLKVPSHRGDQSRGFLEGLAELARTRAQTSVTGSIVHGTTVGTNSILERRGARIGIITTRGFRDVLEMRRRDRRRTWGLWGDFTPIADRDMRIEVAERTLADGTVREAVQAAEVRAAAEVLRQKGAESIAVVFINAYANAENERRAVAEVRSVWPSEHVCASHEVLAEIREFERFSTTALNAYLQPVVGAYLGKLVQSLAQPDFSNRLHIVQSNGGIMSIASARRLPVRTALSGLAAGVVAGATLARAAGFDNIITCDLGGTSFDVCVIAGGKAAVAAQTTIDFGLVIRTPMIEITTIGAGGGSIAWVDRGDLLQVGPESAGSDPGPACYGRGNPRPTLTDAQVVLGRINASRPLGGELKALDVEAAKQAIADHVGARLGLDIPQAAEAIVRVAEARMAGAIRLVSIERGHDPATFIAMAFGGGGALHVGALIREIGLKGALVPRFPGITSALGCVMADPKHDVVQTVNLMLEGLDATALERRLAAAAKDARQVIAEAGISVERIDVHYELDMHYLGQTHTVVVPLPSAANVQIDLTEDMVRAAFEASYSASFSRLLPGLPVRIQSLRVTAIGERLAFDAAVFAPHAASSLGKAQLPSRPVWFDGQWRDTGVWARLDLPVGSNIAGPAILEQPDATIVLEPELTGRTDALGNLIVEVATRSEAA
jgi:N-methylhydantoinase A